jgi:alanyl-tRNA synthetase
VLRAVRGPPAEGSGTERAPTTVNSNQLRESFLTFFEEQGHTRVRSSSLVPGDDPTLLFTNAGMVQFKEVFVGREKRDFVRAASSQRCVRAGGKHNDLENVGYTARHHTFFEMLGNFSFGDYFKREAIGHAWEFLTVTLGLPAERLWVTVYEDDDDAAAIWIDEIGVNPGHFVRIGDKPGGEKYQSDNFWAMGDTGPCGPCSEIFYDHGSHIAGGPPGSPDEDGDRYVEIWNLVFMQFERSADGSMKPLPAPSVDTGMGLERIAAVLQDAHSNYDIDLFQDLIKAAAEIAGIPEDGDLDQASLRVIADHIRACSFLIVDGVMPSNEGRGYVLRRIIRRAIRHGYQLGLTDTVFFHRLVAPLDTAMGEAYPELRAGRANVEKVLELEEQRFRETLSNGMALLDQAISEMDATTDKGEIPGETVFKLYDTFGFPVDLTADVARERGLTLDQDGFDVAMEGQRQKARAASKFGTDYTEGLDVEGRTEFSGYQTLTESAVVTSVMASGSAGGAAVILDRTPFYAESGGQVGDTGVIESGDARFMVEDTQKAGEAIAHFGRFELGPSGGGSFEPGTMVSAVVDAERRSDIIRNHSATHLMHAALREVLGAHVTQKGSLVAPDRLRFDFSHPQPVTTDELHQIEDLVNAEVLANRAAGTKLMSYDDAIEAGAMALFGEKYGDEVRVMRFGDFSVELCGGTHCARTGDIGLFKIIHETGIASGVRRIEAFTGVGALAYSRGLESQLDGMAQHLRGSRDEVASKVEALVKRQKDLEKQLEALRRQLASGGGADLADKAIAVGDSRLVAARVDGADSKSLREAVDRLKDKLGSAVVVLAAVDTGKVRLAAGVTPDLMERVKAGELVNHVAAQVGGKGGGRPDFAQAGGDDPEHLEPALSSVEAWVLERLV